MKNFLKFLGKNKILYFISASQEIFLNSKLNQRITWLMASAKMKPNIWLNYTVWVRKKLRQKHNLCSEAEHTYETLCGGVDVLLHSTTRSSWQKVIEFWTISASYYHEYEIWRKSHTIYKTEVKVFIWITVGMLFHC